MIKKFTTTHRTLITTLAYFLYRGTASAQGYIAPTQPEDFKSIEGVRRFMACTITGWMFTFTLVIGVIMVLYAAYQYLTSGGNEGKTEGARNTLIYGAIGLAVAMIAAGVPSLVATLLNTSVGALCNG